MPHSPIHRPPRPLIVAFVVFLLAAVAAAGLIWRLEQNDLQEQRARASSLMTDHTHALQRGIERALSATYALDALLRQGKGTISNFDAVGRQMLSLYPGVSSVSLAPAGIIRRVVPLAGNEKAVDLDLLMESATKKEASIARDTGKLTLAGPFNLAKGKLAAIGRLPIFLDDAKGNPSFWGFINVEISFPEALDVANLPQLAVQGFDYELWRIHPDTGQKLIISASSSAVLSEPLERTLEVPNATWTLSIMPAKGWRDPLGLSLRAALGLLFSLLLAFVAKLLDELRANKQGLEALVAYRTAEVQARETDLNRAQSIARVGSWILDLTGNKLHCSPETYRIFGVIGETPLNYEALLGQVHPDDRDAVNRAWQVAALKGERYNIEYRLLVGAAIRWVHEQADLEFTADGTQRRCVGTVQDITERKLAGEALARENYRNQVFLRNASDGVHILDADGNVLEVSDSFCEMLGYSREELTGADVSLWDAQWSAQELKQRIAEHTAKESHSIFETRYRRRDGRFLDVEVTGQGLKLDGKPVVFNSARDITERKRARESLRESEKELRAIFEGALDGILVADTETRKLLKANGAICSMLDYTQEEIVRLDISNIHPKQDLPRAIEQFERILRGEIQTAADIPMLRKDGSVFYADIKAAPIQLGGKDCLLGIFRDITERKQAERELVESEARFRGLVEQSIAGTYVIQDGKLAYVNPRFAEIFGYGSPEEIIGCDASSMVAEKDRSTVAESIRQRTTGKIVSISYDFTGLRKDGSMIEVGVHGTRAPHGGRPAVIGLIQDISEKKRAEEKIQNYVAQLETAFMSTVQVATTLSEMRDPYTAGHERRVAEIAVAIGAELGFDARRLEGLRVAGYLHDIGKIIVPTEILAKPGKLSPIEFQLIKGHAQASYDVLKDVKFPSWPVAQVALQHHERMDGSGYPQGLKGEAILIEARIMAVADTVEAMSSHRPYRPGLGIDKALAEIERGRGTAYDADAADACLRLFREKRYQLPA